MTPSTLRQAPLRTQHSCSRSRSSGLVWPASHPCGRNWRGPVHKVGWSPDLRGTRGRYCVHPRGQRRGTPKGHEGASQLKRMRNAPTQVLRRTCLFLRGVHPLPPALPLRNLGSSGSPQRGPHRAPTRSCTPGEFAPLLLWLHTFFSASVGELVRRCPFSGRRDFRFTIITDASPCGSGGVLCWHAQSVSYFSAKLSAT